MKKIVLIILLSLFVVVSACDAQTYHFMRREDYDSDNDGVVDTAYVGKSVTTGTDPDLTIEGQLSYDSDDDALRGIDADGGNQFVIGQKSKPLQFTIPSPANLDELDNLVIWTNRTGFSFIITEVYSMGDTDNVDYDLDECDPNDMTTNRVSIADVTISTDGTGCYYNETTGLSHTVENLHHVVFDADSASAYIKVTVKGYLNADVD